MPRARLLLVEDDTPLLNLLTRYLARLDYTVTTAETGASALARLDGIDAVILDLGLPDMSGERVLAAILAQTQARVLVSSGAIYEASSPRVLSLLKPYTPSDLAAALDRLLA
jgi:two-component system KDP operon response regulator KdpE